MMNEQQIEDLIKRPLLFNLPQAEKEAILLPLLSSLCQQMATQCPPYGNFLSRLAPPPQDWGTLADIPALPVSMFKHFALSAVPSSQVVRELRSSSTTGNAPSRIFIDKTTSFLQARALASVLKEEIGATRRPFLVLDSSQSVQDSGQLSARGAAIRGIANFASSTHYAFRSLDNGELTPDFPAIEDFFAQHANARPLLFGFTFIVWSRFVLELEQAGLHFQAPQSTVLHSGGWKKLGSQAVSKHLFNARLAALLGCPATSILDFYGMVEQVGTVFVDCSAGNKHAPAFADVLIRAPHSLAPVGPGEEGLIEVLSVLPSSYPGHAVITEDLARLLGRDDCPCGRQGQYFRFTQRVERAEIRGCGDTFAQGRSKT